MRSERMQWKNIINYDTKYDIPPMPPGFPRIREASFNMLELWADYVLFQMYVENLPIYHSNYLHVYWAMFLEEFPAIRNHVTRKTAIMYMNQILFAIGLDKIIIDQSFISDYLSELPFKYNTHISGGIYKPKCSICRTPGHDRRNCPEKKEIIDEPPPLRGIDMLGGGI